MVSHISIEQIEPDRLCLNILPAATKRGFLQCVKLKYFETSSWYLAGGTALALQVGHRQSVDLDFFTTHKTFSTAVIEQELINFSQWETTMIRKGTIYGEFMGAKISLIAYPFFIPSSHQLRCGTVRILVPSDIASMKIIAISQRGRKRDYVDLYWYCQNRESLATVIERALTQYPGQEHNLPHILKSLTYFADAEDDPMPRIFFKATWRGVKQYFTKEVPILARKMLKLS